MGSSHDGFASDLTRHGMRELRRLALQIAGAGLDAADGGRAARGRVRLTRDGVEIDGRLHRLEEGQRLFVLGAGKATLPVAAALDEVLGDRIDAACVVLPRQQRPMHGAEPLRSFQVLYADHPHPSQASLRAARRIVEMARSARAGDLVITCFTGGRSALLSLPPDRVGLPAKQELNRLLLASGMPIDEINTVRKHVSAIKGGRLARHISPARVVNLTISDVAGDRLDVLADLTTPDRSTPEEALDLLSARSLISRVPAPVVTHLRSGRAGSPDLGNIPIETVMLVDGRRVCAAMSRAARAAGLDPVVLGTSLEGEARELGAELARQAALPDYRPGSVLLGCGGEGTVSLAGSEFGLGGPNQEAALGAATRMSGQALAAVFIDTDGSDGGTAAAGAVCDGQSAARAEQLGVDLESHLRSHTSAQALEALDDLIVTGPTGTNVNDLFVLVKG